LKGFGFGSLLNCACNWAISRHVMNHETAPRWYGLSCRSLQGWDPRKPDTARDHKHSARKRELKLISVFGCVVPAIVDEFKTTSSTGHSSPSKKCIIFPIFEENPDDCASGSSQLLGAHLRLPKSCPGPPIWASFMQEIA
jgi:hypothetical protein